MRLQYAAVDELSGERDKSLKQRMDKENVAVIISLKTHEEHLGHLYLGYKRNGNMYTKRDLDMIKIAVDQISIALQNGLRFEEIQDFNITLQKRVDEATYQLRQSNKKLQALDEAKDEFISMASHQLRTPLTSVKGYLSMVIEGDAGKLRDDQRTLLNEAYASAERMVYLISDFLNVSRIRTGKFVLESKMSNIADVITGEIGQLLVSARNRNLNLEYDAPNDFPLAYIDQDKIRQVIMNFVDNAIYYTPAGGKITVQLTAKNKEIIFKVTDTGIGVPASERHKLFTKFYRAANARKLRPDGTGGADIRRHAAHLWHPVDSGSGSCGALRLGGDGSLYVGAACNFAH
jgi:signal transduction histidine kinase